MAERPKVLVTGGGVAALETLLALHALVGHRVRLELLAPGTHFMNRPASVAEPFGLGGPAPVPFAQVAGHCRAALHSGTLARVRPDERVAVTADGASCRTTRSWWPPGPPTPFPEPCHSAGRRTCPCSPRCSTLPRAAMYARSRSPRLPASLGRCRCTSSRS